MWILYAPVLAFGFVSAMRARGFGFFAAANPGLKTGGLFRESKYDILQLFPPELLPISVCIAPSTALETNDILDTIQKLSPALFNEFQKNPIIAKPDFGDRGYGVERVASEADLRHYFAQYGNQPILLQECIELPCEIGVFYYRFPTQNKGIISSITLKKFLEVVGNGTQTLRHLIMQQPRAILQLAQLTLRYAHDFDKIIAEGETYSLGSIGNHSRGTMFIDGSHLIDDDLVAVFDRIFEQTNGAIYYGRYDIRCASIADLKRGKNFKILEFNGAAAEPTHIYDPNFRLLNGYKTLFRHWHILYQIAVKNHQLGAKYLPFATIWYEFKKFILY